MRRTRSGLTALAAVALAAVGAAPALAHHGPDAATGPNTTTRPYVLPVADGVRIESLLTVDDAGSATNGYELVGIPDGLGAVRGSGNHFTLFMNHELTPAQGVPRRHGQPGAFVTTFSIDRKTFEVEEGSDTIDPGVSYWNYVTQAYQATGSPAGTNPRNPFDTFVAQSDAFSRFCSGTLSAPGQFRNARSGRGYSGQVYFANEESNDEGRVFGVLPDGTTQQLPRLGQAAWENTKPAYNRSDTTLVIGDEDGAAGPFSQLSIYRGTKRSRGNAFDRAGLTNGSHNVLDLVDETVATDAQFRATFGKGKPAEFDLSVVDWDQSGARQNAEAIQDGLSLNRIEDGTWDPRHPNVYYFLTTEGGDTTSREPGITRDGGGLWKVTFEDIEQPDLGGTIELLLDGSEAPYLNKPDNLDIDRRGNLLIQEDSGNNAHVGRIVAYNTLTGARGVVAQFDPNLFAAGSPDLITIDEESSGIIDAADLIGPGWFVFDAQVHKASPNPANVELGQLLVMKVGDFRRVYDIP
jgi:secreted PhoX family phosphatase